jgi:hypothetical protein
MGHECRGVLVSNQGISDLEYEEKPRRQAENHQLCEPVSLLDLGDWLNVVAVVVHILVRTLVPRFRDEGDACSIDPQANHYVNYQTI